MERADVGNVRARELKGSAEVGYVSLQFQKERFYSSSHGSRAMDAAAWK